MKNIKLKNKIGQLLKKEVVHCNQIIKFSDEVPKLPRYILGNLKHFHLYLL